MKNVRFGVVAPQVLAGASVGVLMLGLFVAAVGHTGGTPLENIQTRAFGAYLGWFALAALAVSQLWLRLGERSAARACGHRGDSDARYCASCGRSLVASGHQRAL